MTNFQNAPPEFWLGFFLVYGLLLLVVDRLAKQRGLHRGGFFLLALFGNPVVAMGVVLILGKLFHLDEEPIDVKVE